MAPHPEVQKIEIQSSGFQPNARIPASFTGDGADRSPALSWSGVSSQAKELALICDDPDAPSPVPWVHWVAYRIPAATSSLPEGLPHDSELQEPRLTQGRNSWGTPGYRGPAPPRGKPHRYFFKLYALDAELSLPAGQTKEALERAMKGHVIGYGEVVGTYQR